MAWELPWTPFFMVSPRSHDSPLNRSQSAGAYVSAFRLFPAEFTDRNLDRCRLPKELFAERKLEVNQWVVVIIGDEVLHCRAWPALYEPVGQFQPFCQPSYYIRRPASAQEHAEWSTEAGPQKCLVKTLPRSLTPADVVTINLTVEHASSTGDAEEHYLNTSSKAAKRLAAKTLLSGLVLSPGCVIEDGTGIKIEIVDMVPRQTFALFAKSTRVSIGASDQSSNSETTDPSHELVGSFEKLSLGKKITPKPIDPIPGLEKAYQGLMDVIMYPLLYPAMIEKLHVEPPKGVLLYGPPGVGKTFLVSNIARACGANLVIIHGPEIFGAYLGESEERLRSRFKEAQDLASPITPCILFIDEIDALTPRRESTRSQENRVVAQLLTLMDGMSSRGSLIVIGATNLPNSIDPALRRPGRFDREVAIDVPSEEARFTILTNLTRDMPLDADVDFRKLAAATNGYVGADLSALCREAAMEAVRQSSASHLTAVPYSAFVKALALMGGPSTQRGTSVSLEKLTWDDVGGLEPVKQKLRQSVEWPLMYRDTFRKLGLKPPKGVLLYGPPGCSKTTLVKIIAATSGATFLSLNGAALYSPYVGDSEQEIRTIFHRARAGAPSVVFFDEIDAIVGKRSLSSSSSNTKSDSVQDRVLSALLNEMDGVEAAKDVLVVGATNRPDMIDAALMRPGRFDRVVYVPPPDREARGKILRLYTKGMQVAADVDLDGMAERTERYTGADLKAVCREAAMEALRAHGTATSVVEQEHFDAALVVVKPTLSGDMLDQYTDFAKTFGAGT